MIKAILSKCRFKYGILIGTAFFILGCDSTQNEKRVKIEIQTNEKLLESINKKDYINAMHYFSTNLNGKANDSDVVDFFKQIEDTFGILKNFNLIKTKASFDSRTGSETNKTRSYKYFVKFSKMDSLTLTIFYDIENKEEWGKIDYFTIDEYTAD